MNFDFSFLAVVIVVAWAFTSTGLAFGNLLLAGVILFSNSLPVSILTLISLTLLSFFVTSSKSRRSSTELTQRAYGVRLLCLFVALMGAALSTYTVSSLLIFFGLLFSLPLFLWSLLFSKYYESMGLRSYLYSVIVPAIVTIDILLKAKATIKADFASVWDIGLMVASLLTALFASWISFSKNRTKLKLIYLAQAWIGWALFLLVVDAEGNARLALTAIAGLVVTSPILISLSSQLSAKHRAISQTIAMGMPGFLAFSALYYSMKCIVSLNVYWLWFFAFIYLLQVLSLTMNSDPELNEDGLAEDATSSKSHQLKFYVLIALQLVCSVSLYFIDVGGLK